MERSTIARKKKRGSAKNSEMDLALILFLYSGVKCDTVSIVEQEVAF